MVIGSAAWLAQKLAFKGLLKGLLKSLRVDLFLEKGGQKGAHVFLSPPFFRPQEFPTPGQCGAGVRSMFQPIRAGEPANLENRARI